MVSLFLNFVREPPKFVCSVILFAFAALLCSFSACWAQGGLPPAANRVSGVPHADSKTFRILRPGTMSIIARDPQTGELGVAVESHYFSVGPVFVRGQRPALALSQPKQLPSRCMGNLDLR